MKLRALLLLPGLFLLGAQTTQAAGIRLDHSRTPASASALNGSPKSLRFGNCVECEREIAYTNKPTSAYQRGLSDLNAGKYSAATVEFKNAIASHDHVVEAWVGIASADVALRQFVAAYHAMLNAARLRPRDPEIQYRTASTALYSDDFHAAVKYASNYIALQPRDPRGFHLRFLAYGNLLDRKHQLADAREIVKLQPHNANALNDLGIALANNRQFTASEQILSRAIALQPSNPEYYSNRAQAEYQQKKYSASLSDLQRSLSLTKDSSRRKQLNAAIAYIKKQIHH